MKHKIISAVALLILGGCSAIPVPVSSAKTFNDVSFESDGCVISPDRKAVCTLTVVSKFRDRTVAVGNGVTLQGNSGEDYPASVRFGEDKWSKTLIADSPYKLNFTIENISTKATSIRSIIINRIDIGLGPRQHLGSHSQVIFSNPEMKPYEGIVSQAPISNEQSSNASTVSDWVVVGYWNYDGVDGQYLGEGLESINHPGSNAGQTWNIHLQLKAHERLPARSRSLWPVKMSMTEKKICINITNYPTYSAFIDFPDDKNDGVFTFQSCQ